MSNNFDHLLLSLMPAIFAKDCDLKYRFHPVKYRLILFLPGFHFVEDNNLPKLSKNAVVVETFVVP